MSRSRVAVRARAIPLAQRTGSLESIADLGLPAGQVISSEEDPDSPVAWLVADQDLSSHWARLVAAFPSTGLWPLIVEGLDGDLERPWLEGEFDLPEGEPGDVLETLRQFQAEPAEGLPAPEPVFAVAELAGLVGGAKEDDAEAGPAHPVLRLAAPGRSESGPVELVSEDPISALLLVPVARPADVLWRLGWLGAVNYGFTGAELSAVLRSWEDRFGAVITHLGFDVLAVQVAAPPTDAAELEALAVEHYAFCPDNIDQSGISLAKYAAQLKSMPWSFWWD